MHGIKYSSTHIDMNKSMNEGSFYNLVMALYNLKNKTLENTKTSQIARFSLFICVKSQTLRSGIFFGQIFN
jgi:hypothetical protein